MVNKNFGKLALIVALAAFMAGSMAWAGQDCAAVTTAYPKGALSDSSETVLEKKKDSHSGSADLTAPASTTEGQH